MVGQGWVLASVCGKFGGRKACPGGVEEEEDQREAERSQGLLWMSCVAKRSGSGSDARARAFEGSKKVNTRGSIWRVRNRKSYVSKKSHASVLSRREVKGRALLSRRRMRMRAAPPLNGGGAGGLTTDERVDRLGPDTQKGTRRRPDPRIGFPSAETCIRSGKPGREA